MSNFKDLLEKRRSVYALGKNTPFSKEEIVTAIRHTVRQAPSASNSQTTRAIVLFDEANEKLWDHIYKVQKGVLPSNMWDMMSGVMEGARDNAVGTVLFFEDRDAVDAMPTSGARSEAYKQNNSAIVQYGVWLRLAEMDLGASLQHFNVGYEQGFDKDIREMFNLPDSYELIAQMPFGSIESPAGEKTHIEADTQVQVFTK